MFFKCRSETPAAAKSEDTAGSRYDVVPSSPSLPPLTDPFFAFDDHEQVPCFSIFNTNQSNPNFSLLNHMDPPQIIPPADDLSIYGAEAAQPSNDEKMIKAVLNHLSKVESGNDQISMKGGSPSFGEGSSDSYLSEVVWNNNYT